MDYVTEAKMMEISFLRRSKIAFLENSILCKQVMWLAKKGNFDGLDKQVMWPTKNQKTSGLKLSQGKVVLADYVSWSSVNMDVNSATPNQAYGRQQKTDLTYINIPKTMLNGNFLFW